MTNPTFRNLRQRVNDFFNPGQKHWPYTRLSLLFGTSLGVWNPEFLPVMVVGSLTVGGVIDGIQVLSEKVRLNNWRSSNSDLVKALDLDYMEEVIDQVKEEHGLRGRPKGIELAIRQQGTGILSEGYLSRMSLLFPEKEVRLMYKYNSKGNAEWGGAVCVSLRRMGHTFAPKAYMADDKFTRLKRWDLRSGMGQVYEFIDGQTLEEKVVTGSKQKYKAGDAVVAIADTVFSNLFRMYKKIDFPIHSPRLRSTLAAKLNNKLPESIGSELAAIHKNVFAEVPHALVHGDVHQGNVLEAKDQVYLIDWDNLQFGIPYLDFFYFSVISDMQKRDDWHSKRDEFLSRQEEIMGKIPDAALLLTEFETYLSLLQRYHAAIDKDQIVDEFVPGMRSACKYLLKGAKDSARQLKQEGGVDVCTILDSLDFTCISAEQFDPQASIAYAHSSNHRYRRYDADEPLQNPIERHLGKVEKIVIDENKRRLYWPGLATAQMIVFTGLAAYYDYRVNGSLDLFWESAREDNLFEGALGVLGLNVAIVYREKIARNIRRLYRSIEKLID